VTPLQVIIIPTHQKCHILILTVSNSSESCLNPVFFRFFSGQRSTWTVFKVVNGPRGQSLRWPTVHVECL
jgi:hypothetical protein